MTAEQQSGDIVSAVPTFPVFRTAPDRRSKKQEHHVGKGDLRADDRVYGLYQIQTRMGSVSQIRWRAHAASSYGS
jgi:hypothetical protein